MGKLSIVIVNWNTKHLLRTCLYSIEKERTFFNPEVFVVDNASFDGSCAMVTREFRWVQLLEKKINLGFAKANNTALKKVRSEYVLILNADTALKKGCLKFLYNFMENHLDVAGCGAKLLNPDGSMQRLGFYRRFPGLIQTLLFYTDLHRVSTKSNFLVNRFWESGIDEKRPIEVDQIPGAFFFARMKVLRSVGYFDESFPIWFEDVDLCFRLRSAGFKLFYVPQAEIIHIGGASFDLWTDRVSKEYRFFRSMFHFFDKHGSVVSKVGVRLLIYANLAFLIVSRLAMQIFSPKKERADFIKLKFTLLQDLVSG